MTLHHSKTWPVSTLAVVQLRVDPNGRTYSTHFDGDLVTDFEISTSTTHQVQNVEIQPSAATNCKHTTKTSLPLSEQHVELFTVEERQEQGAAGTTPTIPSQISKQQRPTFLRHPYKTTVRTDTVSTILEQDIDVEKDESTKQYERFHVLALAKIEELHDVRKSSKPSSSRRVDHWNVIYHDVTPPMGERSKLCAACTAAAKQRQSPVELNESLLIDLPLDARKATTLRRHYYPEGGWGWVIIGCATLVHVLTIGLQLSCAQLAPTAADKFKTPPVHIVDKKRLNSSQ